MAAQRTLRVTLVTHYYPAHRGGVERVAGQLAERLAAAGVARIDWHASDCDPPPVAAGLTAVPAPACNALERAAGIPYPLWRPAALRRLVRACRESDVVHLHDCLYLQNVVAFLAARRARRPVLVTQHIGHVPYRNALLRGLQHAANRALGRLVLGGADQVVFESETVRRYFSGFVGFRRPAVRVQNGVDTQRFQPAPEKERYACRQRLGVPADKPVLLFLGRFVEKKGMPVLRELAQRLPQIHWLFAGWGPLDPASWRLPNATVVQSPATEELGALYQAADLLVLPSVGEGFPLSVQESMACGTPALVGADTAAGCPEASGVLLSERVGGATAERWAMRIQSLLDAPDALAGLRPRVAAFARKQWSWEECVARYSALLRACAE
ncbi:MAG TPA: glycosyltransferase family 4 protein [Burkholderiales bacterium]|nr:glycosyltransferase family 4 protein [Burkholderiales bacterium]